MFQAQHEESYSNASKLGDKWQVAQNVSKEADVSTCIMYSYLKVTLVNVVQSKILKKMVCKDKYLIKKSIFQGIDLLHPSPSQNSFLLHIYRFNHWVVSYKRINVPILEKPTSNNENQGWSIAENGILELVWTTRLIMLESLINLLDVINDEESGDEEMMMEPEDYETDDEDKE